MKTTGNLFDGGIADTRENPRGRSDTIDAYNEIQRLKRLRRQVRTQAEYNAITKEIGALFRGMQKAMELQGQLNILNEGD